MRMEAKLRLTVSGVKIEQQGQQQWCRILHLGRNSKLSSKAANRHILKQPGSRHYVMQTKDGRLSWRRESFLKNCQLVTVQCVSARPFGGSARRGFFYPKMTNIILFRGKSFSLFFFFSIPSFVYFIPPSSLPPCGYSEPLFSFFLYRQCHRVEISAEDEYEAVAEL